MPYDLGPRARRVLDSVRHRIVSGELPPGTKLPAHTALATEYGVAPLTVRQVLERLEQDGLVSREQGRGTFVRQPALPAVLIIEDEDAARTILAAHVTANGYRPILAAGPEGGRAALAEHPDIALVLSDVRMPRKEDGVAFIRSVRRGRPDLPLAAITGQPDDLSELHGTPECPVLILPKPIWSRQIDEALRLAIPPRDHRAIATAVRGNGVIRRTDGIDPEK